MSIFEPAWVKLHKSMCDLYENIAIENFQNDPSSGPADVLGIISKIVQMQNPQFDEAQARQLVNQEYDNFKRFNVYEIVAEELKARNPNVPEESIRSIFNEIRNSFQKTEREHEYFLFFVISKIIEMKELPISRGAYLLEIARSKIPRHNRLVQFFRRWRQIAQYKMTKDARQG